MSTKTQHTPGPWKPAQSTNAFNEVEIESGPYCVARIPQSVRFSEDEPKANACLIAAAPDLLNMLQRVIDEVSMTEAGLKTIAPLTIEHARAAIAKAAGQ